MGRAERRKLERKNRLEENKDKVVMSRQELAEMKRNIIKDCGNFRIEALMTCFAVANHRLYGHGKQRTLRTLECIDALMGGILDDTATLDDYKKELEDDVGIVVKVD